MTKLSSQDVPAVAESVAEHRLVHQEVERHTGFAGGSQAAEGQTEPEAIDPKAILNSLRRKWFVACCLGLIGGALGAVGAWQYFPAPFQAFSELRVSSVGQKILFTTAEAEAGFGTYKETQARLISSPFVLNTAIRDPEIAKLPTLQDQERPTDWLEKQLQVRSVGQEFLRISLEGDRPDDLAKIVNAVSDAFLEEVVNKERTTRQDRLRKLNAFSDEINQELRAKNNALKKLADSLKTTDSETLSVKRQMEYEYYGQLRQEFIKLRFDLMQAKLQLEARKKSLKTVEDGTEQIETSSARILVPESVLTERISVDPEYNRVQNNIRQLEWTITDRLQRLGPKHPELLRYQGQLELLKGLAKELRSKIENRILVEVQANEDATLASLNGRVDLLQVEKDHLEAELNDMKTKEEGNGVLSFELDELKQDIAHTEQTANRFRSEIEALTIEIQAPQRITLHRKAVPPAKPEMGKKYKMSGMAGLGMFGLIAGGVVFLDYRRRRVSSIEEVSGNLRMRIIGAIPSLPRTVLKAVEETRRPLSSSHVALKSVLKEAVDSARAVILREAKKYPSETILITSASDGEGKTSVACQLASSLARAGRKVILVDCDLRRPTVHRAFNLDSSHGFCEILRGDAPLEGAAQPSPTPGLSIIPAGRVDSTALRLLAEGRAQDIYKHLKEDYEFIIVDSAPLLPVSDSLVLAQEVDAVILTIQRDVSRLGNVAAAKQRLEMIGVPVRGAILIGLDEFADKYGYYSRHYNTKEVH